MQTEVMPIESAPHGKPESELYLDMLGKLSQQLKQAMEAIAAGSLPAFEDSIRQQRTMCARLMHLAYGVPGYDVLSRQMQVPEILACDVDADLATRIASAVEALQRLNERYSALLGHSSDTAQLFARLFRGYLDPASRVAGIHAGLSTWSCEV